MTWIKLHQSLFDHKKMFIFEEELGECIPLCAGLLGILWNWCVINAPDALLDKNPRRIARAARWDGEPNKLVGALLKAGFLEDAGENYRVHDWDDYAGALIDSRERDRVRQRNNRSKVKEEAGEKQTSTKTTGGNTGGKYKQPKNYGENGALPHGTPRQPGESSNAFNNRAIAEHFADEAAGR